MESFIKSPDANVCEIYLSGNNLSLKVNSFKLMDRYIVISNHTAEDCRKAVKHFREYHAGFLTHFEWGCYDNDHNAYAIIEAESHEHAKLAVPPIFREKTKVVRLTHFKPSKTSDPLHDAPSN